MISTSIKLDGEAEFKKQLGDVDRNLRLLNSDMKVTTAEFQGNANSLEALTAKNEKLNEVYEQQKAKAEGLAARIELLEKNNLGASKAADDYRAKLNSTRAAMLNLEREIQDNNRYLDEAKRSANGAAKSIDEFGREVEQADTSMGSYGQTLQGFIGDLGKIKGAIVGGAAVGAIKELAGGILELEESTREYRTIMGTLAVSGEEAGYTAGQTAEAYERLQSVLGDPQTAATATANLQAIGLEQEDLMKITDLAIGAWATYGDSIPIDGLAEAINETIQAGTVTGTFADVLNWAGESEDAFNEKLAEAETKTERANIVLQALTEQGLADAANGWFEVNEQIVNANTSEENLRQAWGELGEVLAPTADALRNVAADSIVWLTEKITEAIGGIQDLMNWWSQAKSTFAANGGWSGLWEDLTSGKTAAELAAESQAASVTGGLTGAELREQGLRATDIVSAQQAASRAATSAGEAMDRRGSITTVINIDGREVARATQPYLREEDRSNPEVVSDAL